MDAAGCPIKSDKIPQALDGPDRIYFKSDKIPQALSGPDRIECKSDKIPQALSGPGRFEFKSDMIPQALIGPGRFANAEDIFDTSQDSEEDDEERGMSKHTFLRILLGLQASIEKLAGKHARGAATSRGPRICVPCNNGADCKFLKGSGCWFSHPADHFAEAAGGRRRPQEAILHATEVAKPAGNSCETVEANPVQPSQDFSQCLADITQKFEKMTDTLKTSIESVAKTTAELEAKTKHLEKSTSASRSRIEKVADSMAKLETGFAQAWEGFEQEALAPMEQALNQNTASLEVIDEKLELCRGEIGKLWAALKEDRHKETREANVNVHEAAAT